MYFRRIVLFLACVAAAYGQGGGYAGPSVLTRGQPASNAPEGETGIRPYIAVSAIYDNALTSATVNPTGEAPNTGAYGIQGDLGVYGHHSWKRTFLSLDYRGTYQHYFGHSYYDGTDQWLTLGLTHIISKRIQLNWRTSAGTYARSFVTSTEELQGVPSNEIFDNRVYFFSTDLGLLYQQTARLSYFFDGEGYVVRRRSSSLYGATGGTARADVAYRLSRYTTVGATYEFTQIDFTKTLGDSNVHTAGLNLASRLGRRWEIALFGGGSRTESRFLTTVPIDPAIAALIGQSSGVEVAYQIHYSPAFRVRLSRNFRNGMAQASYRKEVNPGNGFYLTSAGDTASLDYTYTGVRRWSMNAHAGYSRMSPLVQNITAYKSYVYGAGVTRQMIKNMHFIARVDLRHYSAGTLDFVRVPVRVTVGLAWSPGDRPLAFW